MFCVSFIYYNDFLNNEDNMHLCILKDYLYAYLCILKELVCVVFKCGTATTHFDNIGCA